MLRDDDIPKKLPAQAAEQEPYVYIKFHLPGTSRSWFVIEGEIRGEDYLFRGFVKPANEFRQFWLSELAAIRGLFGEEVERDRDFTEGPLTDVVPAPEQ